MTDEVPLNIPGIPGSIKTMMDQAIGPDDIGRIRELPIVWEDSGDVETPEEATSLAPKDNATAPAAEEVQGVPAEEDTDEGDGDLVSAEGDAPEAMAADEVYAASFQSEDESEPQD